MVTIQKQDSSQQVALADGQMIATYLHRVDPSAPWIIFSNSLLTDHTMWDDQMASLAGRWNVLRYDQRGHGKTPPSQTVVNFQRLGEDVVALLDYFDIAHATYAGVSMGVPTGLAAVSIAPDRFCGLMLSDGQAKTAAGGKDMWLDRIASVRAGGQEAYARSTAARWLAEPSEPLLTRLQSMMMATPIQGFEAGALALSDFDFTATLQTITCPVLLVAGEKDGKLPDTMQEMAGSIPGARFEIIAGAGHIPCCERPDAFNALLLAFLETLT